MIACINNYICYALYEKELLVLGFIQNLIFPRK